MVASVCFKDFLGKDVKGWGEVSVGCVLGMRA